MGAGPLGPALLLGRPTAFLPRLPRPASTEIRVRRHSFRTYDLGVKFGISIPNFGTYGEPERVVELAVAAERGGWNGFFVWDHIVIADGMPVADPWVLLGAIAAATRQIRIGPMVAAIPRHRPWVVARQAVTVDRLSDGRMILGVGLGYPPREEFGTFGDPLDARLRADMLDEGLEIIEGVWSGEPFGFEGDHYRIHSTRFEPPPIQSPRIPIWVAAMLPARRPLRRAARFDGVFPINADYSNMTAAEVEKTLIYISEHSQPNAHFDFVIGGPPRAQPDYEDLESAGVTWYLGGPHESESFDETIEWVTEGPGSYRT